MDEFIDQKNLEGSFGQCLRFLLFTHGTRPDGSPEKVGERWVKARFADAVGKSSRSVTYWLDGEKFPDDLGLIERVLFGPNKKYDVWRLDLRKAYGQAKDRERAPDVPPDAPKAPQVQILHPDIRAVPGFTGREDLLDAIDAALWQKGGTAALTNSDAHAAAVKGLGGVGKSVLAREYAWRARDRYRGVWWVRAEDQQTLIDDLIDFGSRLIPNLKEVQERDRALHVALDSIAGSATADKPWLIVYDNVEKPGAIAKLTPKTSAHILITSRWSRWRDHAQELPVDVFPEATAVDFLLAERPHETREAAGRLAAALGYLPLALSHARAYCAETNLSFDDYARRLAELIQEAPEDAEYPASVFATFSLAIAKAVEACPDAEKLMEVAAFLAPERIPLDIITEDVMSEMQREKAVATLFKVSLLTHNVLADGSPAINVHRLVQEVMRSRLEGHTEVVHQIALLVGRGAIASFDRAGVSGIQTIIPHIFSFGSKLAPSGPMGPILDLASNRIGEIGKEDPFEAIESHLEPILDFMESMAPSLEEAWSSDFQAIIDAILPRLMSRLTFLETQQLSQDDKALLDHVAALLDRVVALYKRAKATDGRDL